MLSRPNLMVKLKFEKPVFFHLSNLRSEHRIYQIGFRIAKSLFFGFISAGPKDSITTSKECESSKLISKFDKACNNSGWNSVVFNVAFS